MSGWWRTREDGGDPQSKPGPPKFTTNLTHFLGDFSRKMRAVLNGNELRIIRFERGSPRIAVRSYGLFRRSRMARLFRTTVDSIFATLKLEEYEDVASISL